MAGGCRPFVAAAGIAAGSTGCKTENATHQPRYRVGRLRGSAFGYTVAPSRTARSKSHRTGGRRSRERGWVNSGQCVIWRGFCPFSVRSGDSACAAEFSSISLRLGRVRCTAGAVEGRVYSRDCCWWRKSSFRGSDCCTNARQRTRNASRTENWWPLVGRVLCTVFKRRSLSRRLRMRGHKNLCVSCAVGHHK